MKGVSLRLGGFEGLAGMLLAGCTLWVKRLWSTQLFQSKSGFFW